MRGHGDELQVQVDVDGRPVFFWWRGRRYRVAEHLDRWQERTAWWQQSPQRCRLEESVWRVEASAGMHRGVFEIRGESPEWTLAGVLD